MTDKEIIQELCDQIKWWEDQIRVEEAKLAEYKQNLSRCNRILEAMFGTQNKDATHKKSTQLPKRGDYIRITKIDARAIRKYTKLKEGDVVKVVSSWELNRSRNDGTIKYVRIIYPDGKRKSNPIRSFLYDWEILNEKPYE